MKIFALPSVKHLVKGNGKYTLKRFSDGELYVRVDEDVRRKHVWVVGSTHPPDNNLFELVFLLDALKHAGARTTLFIPYFGYARQDRIEPGEAWSSRLVSHMIKTRVKKSVVLHVHSPHIKKFFKHKEIIPEELFMPVLRKMDVLVAPDKGAVRWLAPIAKRCGKEIVVIYKTRPRHEHVAHRFEGDVHGKRVVIVDDMISTGRTMISAAKALKKAGAKEVHALATHGVFAGPALSRLKKVVKTVTVTNSLPQRGVNVIDIRRLLFK